MFSLQVEKATEKISSVKSILNFKAALMDFFPKEKEWAGSKTASLMKLLPNVQELKVYDHCACFNSLYNIFESLVHDVLIGIITDYQLHTSYVDLPEVFKDRHSYGMGEILQKITQNRYRHLNRVDLYRELHECSLGGSYSITPETIISHDNNIRMELLSELFGRVGYTAISDHLSSCNLLQEVIESSDHAHCTGFLKEFVDRRNDCSHGEVDEILSVNELLFYCEFINALCISIGGFSTHKVLSTHKDKGCITRRGIVIEDYSNNITVSRLNSGDFEVGKRICILRDGFFTTRILKGIQINGGNVEAHSVSHAEEVGFFTDYKLKKDSVLYT